MLNVYYKDRVSSIYFPTPSCIYLYSFYRLNSKIQEHSLLLKQNYIEYLDNIESVQSRQN